METLIDEEFPVRRVNADSAPRSVLSRRTDPRVHARWAWLHRIRLVELVIVALVALEGRAPVPSLVLAVFCAIFLVDAGATIALHTRRHIPPPFALAAVLVLDAALLTLTLASRGGPTNPASVFFLVKCALAAVLLPFTEALVVLGATVGGYALLLFGPPPFGAASCHVDAAAYAEHLRGMFVVNAFASAFLLAVVHRLRTALEAVEENLAEAERKRIRHEKLASLSSLAATAAHELGTPLGTIRVVSRELERSAERIGSKELLEDARLVRAEVERCRELLAELGQRSGSAQGEASVALPVEHFAKELTALFRERGLVATVVARDPAGGVLFAPRRALLRSVANLVKNAIDAGDDATPSPSVTIEVDDTRACVVVEDEGVGMSDEVLAQVGEPFFTTKGHGRGLGLGVFLTAELAQSLDGSLTFERRAPKGIRATFTWPALSLPRSVSP